MLNCFKVWIAPRILKIEKQKIPYSFATFQNRKKRNNVLASKPHFRIEILFLTKWKANKKQNRYSVRSNSSGKCSAVKFQLAIHRLLEGRAWRLFPGLKKASSRADSVPAFPRAVAEDGNKPPPPKRTVVYIK